MVVQKRYLNYFLLFLVPCFFVLRFAWGTGGVPSPAAENSFCGSANINPRMNFLRPFVDITQSTNLDRYLSPDGSKYLLCFGLPGQMLPISISQTLLLKNNTNKPVVISGLNINGDAGVDTLLKLSGSAPVILENSVLGNCSQCILADGKGVQINRNVSIQCGSGGTGIMFLGEDHQVANTQIVGCETGVQMGNASVAAHNIRIGPDNASEYEKNRVRFSRNKVSIKVVNGTGNYFRHNDFENAQELNGPRNIVYIRNSSDQLKAPTVLPKKDLSGAVSDVLNYPESMVSFPEDGSEVTATVRVLSDAKEGGLEILISGASGYTFYKDAKFVSSQQEGDRYTLTYEFPLTLKQLCRTAVFVFHYPNFGTTDNSGVFYLNGPYKKTIDGGTSCASGPGVFSAPSQNDPGVTSGSPIMNAAPIAFLDDNKDKKKESHEEMTANNSTPAVSSDAVQSEGRDVGISKMGGIGGCSLKRIGK